MYQEELLAALAEFLVSPSGGSDGLRCLIAWSLFRELLTYVQPRSLVTGKVPQLACYDHVREVMELALTGGYLRSRVSQNAVRQAAAMFETIRDAFGAQLRASSWLRGPVRDIALRKLARMKAHIGSPGKRLDEEYVDQYYAELPDSPTDRFFDAWRQARSALAHHLWVDQTRVIFDISRVNAFYELKDNAIIVAAAMLQPVFFFSDGNAAFNYGGLGDVMAHEMMHGYDVLGTQFDDSGQFNPWNTPVLQVHYVNKTLCLREFHNRVRHAKRQVPLNDTLDSENLADFVGAVTAYAAFRALSGAQPYSTLPWLNLSPEQLYFVGRCAKKCRRDDVPADARYAPNSARCNVPAMNMAAFSEAFGCGRGARMNPVPKCSFWN
ncbi:neprilysin-1-like [Amblyomma americanum]